MRTQHASDISAAARYLLLWPEAERAAECARLFQRASLAHKHTKTHKTLHPRWGDGSLMSAARRQKLPPEPFFDDTDYVSATQVVLHCLLAELNRTDGRA